MKNSQTMSPKANPRSPWSEEDKLKLKAKMEAARQIHKKYADQIKTVEEELDFLEKHSRERYALEKTILEQMKAEQNK